MTNKAFLQQLAPFKDLSDPHLHQLESIARERSFQKNEVICRLQEAGNGLFVVKEGSVKVGIQDRNNKEIILYVVRPREFFGETSLFDRGHQLTTVIALEPCRILELFREQVMDFIAKNPGVLVGIVSILSLRLRRAEERISRLVFADAYEKVASLLTDALEETKIPLDAGVEVPVSLSHKELASLVGVSRETFTRVMAGFQKAGVLRTDRRHISIVNPVKLKREATRSIREQRFTNRSQNLTVVS